MATDALITVATGGAGKVFNKVASKVSQHLDDVVDDALDVGFLRISAKGEVGEALKRPEQIHHYATNKHSTYTKQMEEIAEEFGLKLDESWNKELLPHQGRHPDVYHEFVIEGMERAASEAKGSSSKFKELFNKYVKEPVRNNPELLRKKGWEK